MLKSHACVKLCSVTIILSDNVLISVKSPVL